ncbi:uncharacterized protein LTR77_001519 [Saxophila tyrrhenica]|uniref:Uncharacterized protein n=1 Tax=Saxophila tyrrhenica TaxID=1690608 RepID=A0AAV9PQ72_9PEZI|nr:hypothetical protein LTR77_001519 [Saxophila tyrrhenica]
MIQKVELLVHAGAPSGREDDDRYRAQAEAYVHLYDGTASVNLICIDDNCAEKKLPLALDAFEQDDNQPEHQEAQYDTTTFLDETQLAYTALDSQLLTSSLVLPEAQRSIYVTAPATVEEDHATRGSWTCEGQGLAAQSAWPETRSREGRAEASSHEPSQSGDKSDRTDSSYLKSPHLDRASRAKRAKTHYHMRSNVNVPAFDNDRRVDQAENISAERASAPPQARDVRSQASADGNQSTSELPTTYSLTDVTSDHSKARALLSQRSASDPGPRVEQTPSIPQGAAQLSDGSHGSAVPATAPPRAVSTAPQQSDGADRKSAQLRCGDNSKLEHARGPIFETFGQPKNLPGPLDELSTSIIPPAPEPALDNYTTHITSGLRQLAESEDITDCFRPVLVTRELRALERGHWLIKVPANDPKWTIERQLKFWKFLERWIGDGSLGWGVWCSREPAIGCLGTIELYCWGEVVKHIYHMLYTASVAQTRKMGLEWIDGGGEVVIRMRGRQL